MPAAAAAFASVGSSPTVERRPSSVLMARRIPPRSGFMADPGSRSPEAREKRHEFNPSSTPGEGIRLVGDDGERQPFGAEFSSIARTPG